jgi:hypothetical protein
MPMPRKDRSALPWSIAALVLGILCLLWMLDPSPLDGLLTRVNYHHIHIPWPIFLKLRFAFLIATPLLTIITFVLGWRRRRGTTANILLTAGLTLLTTSAVGVVAWAHLDGGYTWLWRERSDARSSVRSFAENSQLYAAEHEHRWPPHLAALLTGYAVSPRDLRYRYSKTLSLPEPSLRPEEWPPSAQTVDAHCDFFYLAADLVDSPALAGVAPRFIVAYGKITLPELPQIAYNTDTHAYEYDVAARPVSFADGHAALFPVDEMPSVFAAHNAARAQLGLPPHVFDVPPTRPTTAPTTR